VTVRGADAPHRVGVVLEGETWLLLDDRSETLVRPGDAGPLNFFDQVFD
jgi:hypothetical protein